MQWNDSSGDEDIAEIKPSMGQDGAQEVAGFFVLPSQEECEHKQWCKVKQAEVNNCKKKCGEEICQPSWCVEAHGWEQDAAKEYLFYQWSLDHRHDAKYRDLYWRVE